MIAVTDTNQAAKAIDQAFNDVPVAKPAAIATDTTIAAGTISNPAIARTVANPAATVID